MATDLQSASLFSSVATKAFLKRARSCARRMKKQNEDKKERHEKTPLTLRQVVCLSVVGGTNFLNGMMSGWTAVLPKLQDDTSRFTVTEDDVSWLVSLTFIMGFVISPLAGSMAEHVGPRRLLVVTMFPVAGFWLLQAYSPYLWLLYLGRALLASSSAVMYTVVQPLVAELCPPRIRGLASVLPELFGCVGLLLSYLLASLLSWDMATAVSAAPFLPLSLMILLVPESPYWLVRKKRIEAAERSLRLLLGRDGRVAEELEAIRSTTTHRQSQVRDQVRELRKAHNVIPVVLMLSVFVLRELGGKGPVFNYTVYMFRKAGVRLDAFYCTVFVGVARLASTCVSACTLDLVGRKPLLAATAAICAVSEGVAGAFLFLEVEGAAWVPLASVIVFVVGYGIGLGPIPWVYLGELLPTPVRSLGAALITFGYSITYFTINFVFLKVIASLGLGLTMLVFGTANLAIALIVVFFIPETKGRTLQDMEKAFIPQQVVRVKVGLLDEDKTSSESSVKEGKGKDENSELALLAAT
ncbi:facilitated trehalose transporter Tret1-like isoform X1 [Penaeus japonicus]|uniref:facilitated trehalose transporter Tret1-like isoform X1 n=1 Tax=Penaeus japonicus TaxID=27405 RepID=UPI001C715BB3|nr:facilitated trehalose transporter Tret1-like isoform X1 [Penaeus japonicus]